METCRWRKAKKMINVGKVRVVRGTRVIRITREKEKGLRRIYFGCVRKSVREHSEVF